MKWWSRSPSKSLWLYLVTQLPKMLNKVTWKRYRISQEFGENPQMYKKYGWKWHNGLDIACPVGTHVFASHEWIATVHDDKTWYGKYVKIKRMVYDGGYETLYAHLYKVYIQDWPVLRWTIIGKSGNSGNSTWPHLHIWLRFYNPDGSIVGKDNWYGGWMNPKPYFLPWKI